MLVLYRRNPSSFIKHTLLTLTVASLLAATAFADPIHDAAWDGDLAGVQAELDKGVNVNAENSVGQTPLHIAAGEDHKEIAELLIVNGVDVNAKDDFGQIPLHEAAWEGHTEIVELLIANGADVNVSNPGDPTPLHYAAIWGHKEIVELLIAGGVDVNAKDSVGQTPLHFAAGGDHKEIAELLIANGVDVNAKDDFGQTPLHYATFYVHKEIVELLIDNGADVNAQNLYGSTPLDSGKAIFGESSEVQAAKKQTATLLRKHGGKTGEELAEQGIKETLHTLTVASRDPDSGITVMVSPADQNGQADGTTQFTRVYSERTEVTLTAKQSVGANQFKQWLKNGEPLGTEPTVTVTMDYDRTLRAVYEPGLVVDPTLKLLVSRVLSNKDQITIQAVGKLRKPFEMVELELSYDLIHWETQDLQLPISLPLSFPLAQDMQFMRVKRIRD